MVTDQERFDRLRAHALACRPDTIEWRYLFERGYINSASGEKHNGCRHAMASAYMFAHAAPVIDDGELIVGKPCNRALTPDESADWQRICDYAKAGRPSYGGQASHMAVDYALLLQKGASGIIDDVRSKQQALDLAIPEQLEQYEFYRSCVTVLEGMCVLADRYAAHAAALAGQCDDPRRKAELLTIAANCTRVPRHPATNFYEAVQSAHFLTFCLSVNMPGGLYQLGRPDRYLLPYYERGVGDGTLDQAHAQLLIDCLCLLYNECVASGLAVGLMVGGLDEHRANVENDLTFMFVESVRHVRMIYPGVGLCYNQHTSDALLKLACEVLSEGHSHPALFNDEVIIKGLMHYGLPFADACQYIHSTCVEITPISSSACWVASPYTNLPQLLLDTLGIGCDPVEFATYDALERAYFARLSNHIRNNFIEENKIQIERTQSFRDPLTSCFVNDCITRGVDIEAGGARYNWIMPSFVGVANLADALHAIQKLVYDEQRFTLAKLCDMLAADFVGYESERAMILNRAAKYGNDDDVVDVYVERITQFINRECEQYTTHRGGRLVPSLFCWIMHEQFGTRTIATPDGRRAGFPLGDGSGPAQGRERKGPTASLLSSTKWEHYPFIGGIAVNMKFSKRLFNDEGYDKLSTLIKAFMQRGGFELQLNVVDKETLLKARDNPEQYAGLVVRIGGYSDFFTRLSPAMQQEVIERSEHMI